MFKGNLKCIIVDDEPLARDVIETFISRIESLDLVATCSSAHEAFNILLQHHIDLIFLDIHMPELKGTEFLKGLPLSPMVVFTTAYSDHALEAYNLDVIDYLVKPIEFSRFLKAINKVYKQIKPDEGSALKLSEAPDIEQEKFIYLKIEKKMQKIYLKDILYIESLKNYVKVKIIDREVIAYKRISAIHESLPNKKFLRVHRSFIVSIDYIESFSPVEVEIKGHKIPIGRKYRDMVKTQLGYF
ncbi:LytTR family DNA-binding domain-containing protein [Tamlana sp. 2201CG12-4]|uniref:LytR/AlgR family response regulator transcription factor n=1 Tax=Tamlana sp. 2201CG12-4 TaxID=3112582 RepID=UPI002DB58743|nr:LytTR family DNA-binding domain-containing protein [Tamlana sp. 2201CG12-4]MEC3907627.1 LytTR family DNA-binding domain-containing protein [Tamlana sp. 2201CG12-4]